MSERFLEKTERTFKYFFLLNSVISPLHLLGHVGKLRGPVPVVGPGVRAVDAVRRAVHRQAPEDLPEVEVAPVRRPPPDLVGHPLGQLADGGGEAVEVGGGEGGGGGGARLERRGVSNFGLEKTLLINLLPFLALEVGQHLLPDEVSPWKKSYFIKFYARGSMIECVKTSCLPPLPADTLASSR